MEADGVTSLRAIAAELNRQQIKTSRAKIISRAKRVLNTK
jgi:hypothetical protein